MLRSVLPGPPISVTGSPLDLSRRTSLTVSSSFDVISWEVPCTATVSTPGILAHSYNHGLVQIVVTRGGAPSLARFRWRRHADAPAPTVLHEALHDI
ncbi:hypothetical protein [Paraburkholderia hospita]|jgi:hypothetical protein|uniref:hypothetical protein n=1 Tax=Paraburkholderia hospita TaxID=169430 RepID=UPI0010547837|nr:hypothetical protein [Paraburkholderia hospita]